MQLLASDLWVTEAPLRFLGLEVGARMTIVRLPDGKLWLHSPIAPSPALRDAVANLGPVAQLVAPNKLHHLYIGQWKKQFPEASVYVAPGLEEKRSDLEIAGILGDAPEPAWAAAIDQVAVEGFPFSNEVVFLHRSSGTLLLTDLAFNIGARGAPLTRWLFRLMGAYGRLAPTVLEKLLVRDRLALRRSLERVLAWPFERVVVAHGEVLETGGREALARGYRWLLGGDDRAQEPG